jgi:hypothetical protein
LTLQPSKSVEGVEFAITFVEVFVIDFGVPILAE